MEINWLPKNENRPERVNSLLAIEYSFRKKVTKILLESMANGEAEGIEKASFDFDTKNGSFKISRKTPEPLYSNLLKISDLV